MNHSKIATRVGAVVAAAAATVAVGAGSSAQAAWRTSGTVTATGGLSERAAPTTHSTKTGSYSRGARVNLYCYLDGGVVGRGRTWFSTSSAGNRWVSGTYVSTKSFVPKCPSADTEYSSGVTTTALNLRAGPSTSDRVLDWYPVSGGVTSVCKVRAQNIDGNDLWYLTESGSWVSARYVRNVDGGPASNLTPVWCR